MKELLIVVALVALGESLVMAYNFCEQPMNRAQIWLIFLGERPFIQ